VPAQTARPSDDGVVSMIETVQKDVKEFERKLDKDVRKGKVRGPTAEVDVDSYLEDFNDNLEKLGDRFKKDYSASSEVLTVLNQANGIQRFIDSQPPTLKGRSEWDVAKASLNQLAGAYGTAFPLPANPSARRINDAELEQAAELVAKQAETFRKGVKDAYSKEEKGALETVQADADAVSDAARKLASKIDDEKPATGEAANLARSVAAVEKDVAGRTLPAAATAAWAEISKAMNKINQSFGVADTAAKAEPAPAPAAESAPAPAAESAPAPAPEATAAAPSDAAEPTAESAPTEQQ
jgi:hypothetical protein